MAEAGIVTSNLIKQSWKNVPRENSGIIVLTKKTVDNILLSWFSKINMALVSFSDYNIENSPCVEEPGLNL